VAFRETFQLTGHRASLVAAFAKKEMASRYDFDENDIMGGLPILHEDEDTLGRSNIGGANALCCAFLAFPTLAFC